MKDLSHLKNLSDLNDEVERLDLQNIGGVEQVLDLLLRQKHRAHEETFSLQETKNGKITYNLILKSSSHLEG